MLLRWSGALLVVLPFALAPLKRDWPMIRGNWLLYLFYGAVGFATFNVLVYVAAHFTSGVNIAIEQVAVNIFVMLLNFALFRTRVRSAAAPRRGPHHRRRGADRDPRQSRPASSALDVNVGDCW